MQTMSCRNASQHTLFWVSVLIFPIQASLALNCTFLRPLMAYVTQLHHRVCTLHFLFSCYKDNTYFLANSSMPQVPKLGMAYDMLSRPLLDALKGLTMIEQKLIARCHHLVRAYRFAGGQYGYRGHILNLDEDIRRLVISFPCRATSDDIPTPIIKAPGGGTWRGHYFNASRVKVENALILCASLTLK